MDASILAWLNKLVAVDTISSKSNLGLIEMVRDDLARQGLTPILSYNSEGSKANLFVTLAAADGTTHGGLVFSGHTDVVPVEGQAWSTAPFTPTLREGRLYGRGSADMKGFLAVVLALVPKMLQLKLAQPLHIALSFDEEVGCLGIQTLLADLAQRGIRPTGCLIGEPTGMMPVIAHKGMHHFRCRLHGCEAHSSLAPRAVNSIEYAARLIGFIRSLMDGFARNGPFDDAFDVPHSTAQTSSIRGGSAINIVPNLCEFEFEFRNLPQTSADEIIGRIRGHADQLQQSMRMVYPEALIDIRNLSSSPALNMAVDDALVQMVCRYTDSPHIAKVAYGTEGGYFVQAGIPAVVCGPGHIAQAHRPDEYIETAQLEKCRVFLEKLLAASSVI